LSVASLSAQRTGQELSELLAIKKLDLPASDHVEAYDASYYEEKLRQSKYAVDNTEVRKYFKYTSARDGVMWVAEQLFGIGFERATLVPTWHEDVEVYDVFWGSDKRTHTPDKVIGRVYLDMFPRDNKYKHAAQFPIRKGVQGVQIPEGALMCNFPKVGPMEHSQVTTLFHEFGHLIHHIVGGQEKKFELFSGVATEWDFVEAPSQMLEEWAFDPVILQHFALDDAKNPIPTALVQKLKNADLFGKGLHTSQQMFYAQLSLQLHLKDKSTFDTSRLVDQIQLQFSPFPPVPDTYLHASFGHLIGYSAVYYTYMWSKAQAQHMFEEFKKNASLLDPFTALRYRDKVIRPGGTNDASVLVFDFVKRPFSLDALHKYLNTYPQPQS
jgi:thimet oligopeptidase